MIVAAVVRVMVVISGHIEIQFSVTFDDVEALNHS